MRTTAETLIDAPPDAVFDGIADIARWPERMTAVARVELLTAGPVAVGTRFRQTRRMFGREETEEMTVAEVVRPHRLVLTAFNHGTEYRIEHRLTAEGGGARLTLQFEGRPRTLMALLLAPLGYLMRGAVTRQLASDLADIKRAAERRAREARP